MLIDVGDTRLHVTERGEGELAHVRAARRARPRPHDVRHLPRRAGRPLPPAARRRARHGALGAGAAGDVGARASRRRRRGDGRRARARALRGARPFLRGVHRAPARRRLPGQPGRHHRLQRDRPRALPRARRGAARRLRARRAARAGAVVVGARGAGAHAGGRRRAALRPAALPLRRPARPAHRRDARRHDRRGLRTRRAARGRDRGLRRDRRRGSPRRRHAPGARARRAPRPHLPGGRRRGDGRRACPTPSSWSSSTAGTWPSSRRTRPTSPPCATSSTRRVPG